MLPLKPHLTPRQMSTDTFKGIAQKPTIAGILKGKNDRVYLQKIKRVINSEHEPPPG